VSSISVLVAMLMALAGSRNDTQSELIESLRLSKYLSFDPKSSEHDRTLSSLHDSVAELLRLISIENSVSQGKVQLANRLVLNQQLVEDAFLATIQSAYKADIDYARANESLTNLIDRTNKWSSDLTSGKIDKILGDDFKCASLALINIIYLNQEWKIQFDEKLTTKEKFHVDPERFVQVDMMKLTGKSLAYIYSSKLGAHLISVPYTEGKFNFNIVLPANEEDFLLHDSQESVLNTLSYDLLKEELNNQEHQRVDLQLPRFSIKKTMQVILNQNILNLYKKITYLVC
jgi:serine protease inhibitor